ncbi:MAG TPA: TIGR03545 family protein, partial [Syntrophobacteria bacterium]|nr:TIGR03545 family protein [Syntrophobacteria bacterium]
TLKGLQVANPEEPMANALEVARITGTLDGPGLLRRRVIINEMSVEGIRLNMPRKSSGALRETPGNATRRGERLLGSEVFSLSLPGVEKIVEQADLQSPKLAGSLQAESKRAKERWEKRLTDLPGRDKAAEYGRRIEALKQTTAAATAQGLRKDILRDLETARGAQQEFAAEIASLRERVVQLERAPLDDFRRLREQVSTSPQGLTSFSRLLFGPRASLWVERALLWHERLQPFLHRGGSQKGVVKPLSGPGFDVRFREQQPLPDFLIRSVSVAAQLGLGDVVGRVRNLTPDQNLLGQPVSFAFAGEGLPPASSLTLEGEADRVSRSTASDTMKLRFKDFRVENLAVSEFAGVLVTLVSGTGTLEAQAVFNQAGIFLDLNLALDSARFSVEQGKASAAVREALSSALGRTQRCSLKASARGTVKEYRINITSDLEDVLKEAVAVEVKGRYAKIEDQVRSVMAAKLTGPFREVRANMEALEGVARDLEKGLAELTELQKNLPQ